ncbi:helix-turn-helix domain-containing protein, partial [Kroppenstedtia eburnea]
MHKAYKFRLYPTPK